MQKLIHSLALLLLVVPALASPVTKVIRITDSSGNPVGGATLAAGGTTLVAGTATTVPGKNLTTAAVLTAPLTYYDYNDGTGEYAVTYDPATAEAHFAVTASKSSVTISNPTFGLDFYADPSIIASTNANTVSLGTGQTNIINQTSSSARQGDMNTVLDARGLTSARAAKLDNADVPTSSRLASLAYTAPPTDYQQRGVPVSLPATAPAGYGGSAGGTVTLTAQNISDIAAAVMQANVDGTITHKQVLALLLAYSFNPYTRTKTTGSQSLVYQNRAGLPIATTVSGIDPLGNITGRTSVTFTNLPQ